MSKRSQAQCDESSDVESETSIFNPISKWKEYEEVPGLTLYEIFRKPRFENPNTNATVTINLKALAPEFQCPVCLGYIKTARIVKECLHRFCNECIEKCLRIGKKQCPQCRIYIPSRRSLRPDTNFDELIDKLYGDVSNIEEKEDEENVKLNKQSMINNEYCIENVKRRIILQNEKLKHKTGVAVDVDQSASQSNGTQNDDNLSDPLLMDIILRRHPEECGVERLGEECIRTSQNTTIEQMKMFLGKKLQYSPYSHFQLYTVAGESMVTLSNELSLIRIRSEILDNHCTNEIILYYRVNPSQDKDSSERKKQRSNLS